MWCKRVFHQRQCFPRHCQQPLQQFHLQELQLELLQLLRGFRYLQEQNLWIEMKFSWNNEYVSLWRFFTRSRSKSIAESCSSCSPSESAQDASPLAIFHLKLPCLEVRWACGDNESTFLWLKLPYLRGSEHSKYKDEPHDDTAALLGGSTSFSRIQLELTGGGSRVQSRLTPTYTQVGLNALLAYSSLKLTFCVIFKPAATASNFASYTNHLSCL